jgi:hypothetical protein
VVGRSRTCDAPRFRRPLSTELRPRGVGEAGFEPATTCVLDRSSGLAELLARVFHDQDPGQGLEPRSPHSECGVLPARRPRNGRSFVCMSRSAQAERCCSSHSPALRPWIARTFNRAASYVEGIWSRALLPLRKFAGKSSGLFSSEFSLREAQRGLSLLGGASSRNSGFSSWASLLYVVAGIWSENDEGDPLGRLRSKLDAASLLARRPPSEGWIELVPAQAGGAIRRGRHRKGVRRFGEIGHGCLDRQHGLGRLHAATQDRSNIGCTQGSN